MAARVQIVVEAKDATSGVFRAITSELGAFGGVIEELTAKNVNWGNVTAMAGQMVVQGLKESIRATTEYAREVRDLSLASGQSAEESSRMLQVLDDYQLTADDAKTATRALTKEGLAPTIDTVANLSAQFQQLSSVEERNAFVQKNLGRAGQEWLNLLSQGPDKIRAMNAAVSESLILTEENVKQAEEYRLALDAWGDAVEGVKIQIGTQLLPALTQMMEGLSRSGEIRAEANRLMQEGIAGNREEALAMAAATVEAQYNTEALQANGIALDTATQSATELAEAEKLAAEAVKLMDSENKLFLSTLGNVKVAQDTYYGGLREAKQALDDGKISAEEHAAKVGELAADYKAASADVVLSIVEMKLAQDGWTDAELGAYLDIGMAQGKFTKDQVAMAKGAIQMADSIVAGMEAVEDPLLHVGKRAEDNAEHFGLMAESGAELGESLRKEVASGAAAATSALNTIPTDINVDIWIKVHGGGFLSQFANTTTTNSAIEDMRDDSGGGRQMGGEVFAGMPYNVGEGGMEKFIPSTNGRIVGHKAALHQAGLMGGGSQRNIFYGPVTLQIGEDSAAGFMSLR
jgi:hypothetical protein